MGIQVMADTVAHCTLTNFYCFLSSRKKKKTSKREHKGLNIISGHFPTLPVNSSCRVDVELLYVQTVHTQVCCACFTTSVRGI